MKNLNYLFLVILLFFQIPGCGCAAPKSSDKMDWWKEARFGMFIHWGLYSIPAGEWNNHQTKIGETTEWIQCYMKIPVADYKALAGKFNPTKFNADDIVSLAKEAGMKYIVLTSKHHEGFAMFKSADPFNVVDATPYRKDIVKSLAEACKKQGMHFGLYYSQAQDWNHAGGAACSGHWDKSQEGAFDKYLDEVSVPQIKEILSSYNPEILWWDTPCEMTKERAAKFAPLLAEHPDLIVNNRLCAGIAGDLETPEQFIPAMGYPGTNWESCMTMNGTWGYGANDHNWKSSEVLVRNLIDIASKGGNYLLNVGPTSAGLIPDPSIERLKEIGSWMKINGEAIYGTQASPFTNPGWGRCTIKKTEGKTRIYLHIFDFPEDGILRIPGLASKIDMAYELINRGHKLNVESAGNYQKINVSKIEKGKYATVLVLETSDEVVVYNEPEIKAEYTVFTDKASFIIHTEIPNCIIHYTTDGSIPTNKSPTANGVNTVKAQATLLVKAICFLNGKAVSGVAEKIFYREIPLQSSYNHPCKSGLRYSYFEGAWGELPDFKSLKALETGITGTIDLSVKKRNHDYGIVFTGLLNIPETGVYKFILSSNDGSKMILSGKILSNDGLHGIEEKSMDIALAKGLHSIEVQYFQAGGGDIIKLEWKTKDKNRSVIDKDYFSICDTKNPNQETTGNNTIDKATLDEWSAPYRNWHYFAGSVVPSDFRIPGYEKFQNFDVPTIYQIPGKEDTWFMSFIGYNGQGYNSFVMESTDLLKWTNPRLAMGFGPQGEFDFGGCVIGAYLYSSYDVRAPRILKKLNGKFLTLYGSYAKQGSYEIDPGYEGVAESEDGMTWKRAKQQYILSVHEPETGNWEKDCIYQPWLVEFEGRYYNFYNAKHMPDWIEQIGIATSQDALNWVRHKENPVIRVRPGEFDDKFCSDGKVFRDGDHWVMFYFGVGKGGAHIMVAFSRDLIHWTSHPEPLYKAGGHPGGLDKQYAHKISLVYNAENDTYYLYYCAVGNKGRCIGLLTSHPLQNP